MLAAVATFTLDGVHAQEVTVEVDVRRGLPTFTLVGLPDRAIRESRERVRAALLNSGLEFPQKRLTVNLAPAHVRKAGPSFDLAIAVGLLAASSQVPPERLEDCALVGELSLSGELRPVRGTLTAALGARRAGYRRLLVPEDERARGGAGGGDRGERHPDPGAARGPDARPLVTRSRRAPPSPIRTRRRPAARTWPTCAGRRTPSARSRSPPRAATTC